MTFLNKFRDLALASKEGVAFEYTASGGGGVKVPRIIRPYEELGVAMDAPREVIKRAYMMAANHHQRQERVMGSLSYMILVSKVPRFRQKRNGAYEFLKNPDAFVIAAAGDTKKLIAEVQKDRSTYSY